MPKEVGAQKVGKEIDLPASGFVLLHGEEELLHRRVLELLKRRGGYRTVRGENLEPEELLSIIGERSLFGNNSAVVVQNAQAFFSKLRGKKQKERVVKILSRRPTNLVLFRFLKTLKKTDLSKEPLRTLYQKSDLVIEAKKLPKNRLAAVVAKRLKEAGVQTEEGVVELLLESVQDLTELKSELEKLITYAGSEGKITLKEARELLWGTPQKGPFDLQEEFFNKNFGAAAQTFELLSKEAGETPSLTLQLSGLILSTAERLLTLKELLKEKDFNAAAKGDFITPFRRQRQGGG